MGSLVDRVPEPRGLILAAGQYGPTIGAEGHSPNFQSMPHGRAEGFSGRRVPLPRHPVGAPGEKGLAVRAICHGPDRTRKVKG